MTDISNQFASLNKNIIDVKSLYTERFEEKQKFRKQKIWNILCRYFFQKYVPHNGIIMDIAAGDCGFINNIKAKEKIAVDINPDIHKFCKDNTTVICDSLFNMQSHINIKVDIIFASNIFEHLNSKEDVIMGIKICWECLKPGGRLLILQPNIRYTGGAYWDFIDHKIPLTDKSLIEAGKLCGFTVVKKITKFLPYTTKSKFPQHPLFVFLYLKIPILWHFLGKQSFLIMEKSG